MKIKFIFFTVIFFCLNKTYCQKADTIGSIDNKGWELVAITNDNNDRYFMPFVEYYPEDDFGVRKVWIKVKSKKFGYTKNGKKILRYNVYAMELAEIKCTGKQMRMKQYVLYDSAGNVLDKSNYYDEFSDVVPESIGETLLNKACQLN